MGAMNGRLAGVCIGFLGHEGLGLVHGGDGTVYRVHFRDIVSNRAVRKLNTGDAVSFTANWTRTGGPWAVDVRPEGRAGTLRCMSAFQFVNGWFRNGDTRHLPEDQGSLVVVEGDATAWVLNEGLDVSIGGTLAFVGVWWPGWVSFAEWHVRGNLVFLGCRFAGGVSFRGARIDGDLHLEGCDFSGEGSLSLRGLRARRLFLDHGVKGPNDFVWMNEMEIDQDVMVGGEFPGGVQVRRLQRTDAPVRRPARMFRRLVVGAAYDDTQAVHCFRAARLDLDLRAEKDGCGGEEVVVEHGEIGEVQAVVGGRCRLAFHECAVHGNLRLHGEGGSDAVRAVSLEGTMVGGNLEIVGLCLESEKDGDACGGLNLDRVIVQGVLRLEEIRLHGKGGIRLAHANIARFVGGDMAFWLGASRSWGERLGLRAPRFRVLQREAEGVEPHALLTEYTMLKNLFAQEGHLDLEDIAFLNMQRLRWQKSRWRRLLFGVCFGWGVRLRNIMLFTLVLVLGYGVLFWGVQKEIGAGDALMLSLQAMFLAFFGEWPVFARPPSDALGWLVVSESVLGVIVVTVFVGAYIRKFLR